VEEEKANDGKPRDPGNVVPLLGRYVPPRARKMVAEMAKDPEQEKRVLSLLEVMIAATRRSEKETP